MGLLEPGPPAMLLSSRRSPLLAVTLALVVVTCRDDQAPSPTEAASGIGASPSAAALTGPVTLVGAGNIATCDGDNDEATVVAPGTRFASTSPSGCAAIVKSGTTGVGSIDA